jgi:hypothetical protein
VPVARCCALLRKRTMASRLRDETPRVTADGCHFNEILDVALPFGDTDAALRDARWFTDALLANGALRDMGVVAGNAFAPRTADLPPDQAAERVRAKRPDFRTSLCFAHVVVARRALTRGVWRVTLALASPAPHPGFAGAPRPAVRVYTAPTAAGAVAALAADAEEWRVPCVSNMVPHPTGHGLVYRHHGDVRVGDRAPNADAVVVVE